MGREKGITLIALVITIIVLIILAGISIQLVLGENGIITKAKKSKEVTEISAVEEKAQLIYADKQIENGLNSNQIMQQIIEELKAENYNIEQVEADEHDITGIKIDKDSINMGLEKTEKITVSFEGIEQLFNYYFVTNGKYYKIHFNNGEIVIDRTESTIEKNEEIERNLNAESSDETVATVEVDNNTNVITITSSNKEGMTDILVTYGTFQQNCNVKVERVESNWKEIAEIAKAIAYDSVIDENSQTATGTTENGIDYNISVGQIFELKYDGKIKKVRVLGFKQDELVNTGIYGDNHTKASITFEFIDLMTGTELKQMNSEKSNSGGWAATQLRKTLNGYINNDEVQNFEMVSGLGEKLSNRIYIKQVRKTYIPRYNIGSTSKCDDFLWLLSCAEIWSSKGAVGGAGHEKTREGTTYPYYKAVTLNKNFNTANTQLVKYDDVTGNPVGWWLRSPIHNVPSMYDFITNGGNSAGYEATSLLGVSPAFCI